MLGRPTSRTEAAKSHVTRDQLMELDGSTGPMPLPGRPGPTPQPATRFLILAGMAMRFAEA
jgi:hypothetical protein